MALRQTTVEIGLNDRGQRPREADALHGYHPGPLSVTSP
jgi:hypothetical protein